ncbi:MAG: sodium:solute symporter family protein [Saprospiraceae bacterium]|nr:sodium:solute symporter family protein [Saprospiraceae bacterium]MBP7680183.1 sodium:solute symporter family protein [Saprospiraceae bacterium]
MLLFFIICYLIATIAAGWWASRFVKTTQDFVVAGKQLPMIVVASGLFATWFGSETVMGASSAFLENGILGIIEDPFGAALCLFLIGLLIARPLYKHNLLTFSDFFRWRFDRKTEFASAIAMVPSYFGWIAAQLVALAIVLQVIAGVPLFLGIFICTCVVVFYTFIGGMWSVSVTDFIQAIAIIIGLLILMIELLIEVGGFKPLVAQAPENFFQFFPNPNPTDIINYIAAWMTIALGSIPQQDIFQRVMSAKSERTAVYASYLSSLMYLSVAFIPLIIAWCGKTLYPDIYTNSDAQNMLPLMVLRHSNIYLQILFFGALLSAILSTTSGAMLAPATVIGENLVRPYFNNLTDRQLLRIMRWSVLGVAMVSAMMANMNSNIYELVGSSSALSLVSLFVPLIAGLYWKRASAVGAIASMVAGMGVWLFFEWRPTEINSLVYGLLASILAMVLGSYIRPKS